MHGIVHQTLKEYVVDRTDEEAWAAVLDRAGIEPKLYLQVSRYPDEEVAAILEALAAMSGHDPAVIERDFGRALAPVLVRTFKAHVRPDRDPFEVLDSLETIYAELSTKDGTNPPAIACERDGDVAVVTYRSDRDHCAMAHGILDGLLETLGADATVTETGCVHDGDEVCRFRVERR